MLAWLVAFSSLLLGLVPHAAVAQDFPDADPFGLHTPIMVVMDTSGSMDEAVGAGSDVTRIQAARSAVLDLVTNLGNDQPFGLLAYPGRGAQTVDGCQIGRVEVPLGPLDVGATAAAVRRLNPDGGTPTGPALEHAAELIHDTYGPEARGVIVLVSDGESNCGQTPVCEVAQQIRASGLEVQINTVGLSLEGAARHEMECVADVTGGRYTDVGSGSGTDLATGLNLSAQAALRLSVTAPSELRPVTGTGDGGSEFTVTVRSDGRVTAADVRVSLVVHESDGTRTTILVPRPVRFLGNLGLGESQTITFVVRPDDQMPLTNATWTAVATARNAAPEIKDGSVRVEYDLSPSQMGGVLAGVENVVILGDSYSSGEGAGTYQEGTRGGDGESECHRSETTYGHAIWGDKTTVIACSGAVTSDFFGSQTSGEVRVRAQLAVLRDMMLEENPPDAVLLSVGGNDANFGGIAIGCIFFPRCDARLASLGGGIKSTMTNALELGMGIQTDITTVLRSVDAAVNDPVALQLREGRSIPIVVMPYPRVIPETSSMPPSGCFFGIGHNEISYLNGYFDSINTSVSLAAFTLRNEGRPVYVAADVESAFQPDHTVCEGEGLSHAVLISTDTLNNQIAQTSRVATFKDVLANKSELLHPTPGGHTAMARALVDWSHSRAAREIDPTGTPEWDPRVLRRDVAAIDRITTYAPPSGLPQAQAGGPVRVSADGFMLNSEVLIRVESDPRTLGTAMTDDVGELSTFVRLPDDLAMGTHHVVVTGFDQDGELRRVATELRVLPQGGPWLYVLLGLGTLLALVGVAMRRWRPSRRSVTELTLS